MVEIGAKARLQLFERLFSAARRFKGRAVVEKVQGQGVDFGGQRRYIPGDDFRRIDWKAHARLEKLIIKETEQTRERKLDIIVDASESMECGFPAPIAASLLFAGALGAFGLGQGIGVRIRRSEHDPVFFLRGRDKLAQLSRIESRIDVQGWSGFRTLLQRSAKQPTDIALISDGFWPQDWPRVFSALNRRRRIYAIFIVPQFELEPVVIEQGGVQLQAAESGEEQFASLDRGALEAMTAVRNRHVSGVMSELRQSGVVCFKQVIKVSAGRGELERMCFDLAGRVFG